MYNNKLYILPKRVWGFSWWQDNMTLYLNFWLFSHKILQLGIPPPYKRPHRPLLIASVAGEDIRGRRGCSPLMGYPLPPISDGGYSGLPKNPWRPHGASKGGFGAGAAKGSE
nr:hypothetical protein [Morchella crassipes]